MSLSLGRLELYLIAVNLLGFALYGVNTLLYRYTARAQIDVLLTVAALLGGSLGIMLWILLFDRKSVKENMMSRVFLACALVIQALAYLFFKGWHNQPITFAFWEYFAARKPLLIYLVLINLVTFAAFGVDKLNAVRHRKRIRILTLLGLSFVGGAPGGWLAMRLFRHKTRKDYFTVGLPLMMLTHAALIFWLMNR